MSHQSWDGGWGENLREEREEKPVQSTLCRCRPLRAKLVKLLPRGSSRQGRSLGAAPLLEFGICKSDEREGSFALCHHHLVRYPAPLGTARGRWPVVDRSRQVSLRHRPCSSVSFPLAPPTLLCRVVYVDDAKGPGFVRPYLLYCVLLHPGATREVGQMQNVPRCYVQPVGSVGKFRITERLNSSFSSGMSARRLATYARRERKRWARRLAFPAVTRYRAVVRSTPATIYIYPHCRNCLLHSRYRVRCGV